MSGRDQATCGDAELQWRGTPDTPHNPSSRLIPVSRGTKAPASVGAPFLLHYGTKRFRNLGDVGGDARRRTVMRCALSLLPVFVFCAMWNPPKQPWLRLKAPGALQASRGIREELRRMVTIRPRIFFSRR